MPSFKEMDPNDIWQLIDATDENGKKLHPDVLGSLADKEQAQLKNIPCPSCKSYGSVPFVNPQRPFVPGVALPNKLMRCVVCKTEFDPYTGIITLASPVSIL